MTYKPGLGCKCASCERPLPIATYRTQSESLALNRDYEAARRRYRTENPNLTRADLAILDGGA